MNIIKSPRFAVTRLMLLLCLLMLGIITLQWLLFDDAESLPGDGRTLEETPLAVEPVPKIEDFNLPGLDAYAEMNARPLFIEGRRPVDEQADEDGTGGPGGVPGVGMNPLQQMQMRNLEAKLMGVIISPDEMKVMIMDADGKYQTVRVGAEPVPGWRIKAIHEDRVTMDNGMGQQDIYLRKPKPKQAPRPTPRRITRQQNNQNQSVRAQDNRTESDEPQQDEQPNQAPPGEPEPNETDAAEEET